MDNVDEVREYPFDFSIVMAVYNVEPFLQEAVESLINQTWGFEHVQLIMVDDGSTDGSGAICDEYAELYPENVKVIHKKNGGVASARNAGLPYVQGKYVNFMDSDDKLDTRTLSAVYRFFEHHYDETDVVAIPLVFFDGQQGHHMLNYKFKKKSRIIDLYKEWSMIQLSISSAFVKQEMIVNKRFDEKLMFAEDAKCLIKILMEKMMLGVVQGGKIQYLYRKRMNGESSAIQNSDKLAEWYLPPLKYFHQEIIDYTLNKFGYLPKFVQFTLAYDLQWKTKIENVAFGVLSAEEEKIYKQTLFSLYKYIDDDIIMAQKHIFPEHKLFVLQKKYNKNPELIKRRNNLMLCFNNTFVFHMTRCQLCLEFLTIDAGNCSIEGYTVLFPLPFEEINIQIMVNGEIYPCEMFARHEEKHAVGEPVLSYYGFKVSFPLLREEEKYNIKFFVNLDGFSVVNKNLKYKQFFPVSNEFANAYYVKDDWKVKVKGNSLNIVSCGRKGHINSEKLLLKELKSKNKPVTKKAVWARLAYHFLKFFKRKPIWLISDRIMKADDNGEAFFEFMQKNHKKDVKTYFVLSKDSVDYNNIKKMGPVVNALSFKHKLLHLLCDYNISSQADNITENPFVGYHGCYRDILANVKYIFLQHGITKDDISGWVNRYNKNIYGFITAAKPEYMSILNGKYAYSEREIWLTGFPRFDRLYNNEQKIITIMPTWRKYLMLSVNPKTGQWLLSSEFQNSSFFQFYNELLNSKKLLKAAQKYGYTIQLLPHPTLQAHLDVFTQNENVRFLDMNTKYRDVYAESNLVVTDYSSAVFDFAYLHKPVLYCQFDADECFAGEHVYTKGYFDYERDGFGEVEYDLESTINRIIEYMENGCQLKDKYRERIDKFFAYNDKNNCQRVYEKIMALSKQEN